MSVCTALEIITCLHGQQTTVLMGLGLEVLCCALKSKSNNDLI